jgi:hypothetical protein
MKKIRWLCCDESGIETVQWLAWGAVLLILIAVIYGVFNGNARLRAAIRGTTAVLATRFGSDIGARGPNGTAPCLDGPFSVQRCNGASQISFTPVQPIVFDPRTQSYVVFSPIERLVIKPAAGVPTVADPRTGELLLFDTPHQRIIRVNLIEQRVIAIDQITGVATPLPLEALLQHRLIEIQVIDAPAIAPLSLATLGVPRVLPDRLALLAAFVGGAGLLGLARRGAQWGMPASGGAAANVPPWLAALGQVFLGLLIGVGALLALAALIYAGAALLAAVGIGAALSFAAALAVAAVILAVGFVALEFSERMQAFRARRGEPGVGEWLLIAGLSLAALTGVPQIIEALRGAQLVSEQPLSEGERWRLGLGGVVQLAVMLAGVRVVRSRLRVRPALQGTGAGTAPASPAPAQGRSGGAPAPAPKRPPLPDDPAQPPAPGWMWRGKDPPGGIKGAWYNPSTKESLHPDLQHPPPIGPHWDYKDASGTRWRVFPDGRMEPEK